MRHGKKAILLILHNIRSVYNVGSIFRTADAAGVAKIYLTGYTPAPLDRFGRKRRDFAKVSLGAEEYVPWEQVSHLPKLLCSLQKEGVRLVAVEQDVRAVHYKKRKKSSQIAFIFGNETKGVPASVLNRCDEIIEIPMKGEKESLNVSVAAGIVLFS